MTYIPIIKQLQKQFGGGLHTVLRPRFSTTPIAYWNVGEQAAGRLLKKVLPYLRVKHKQAKLHIALCARKTRRRAKSRPLSAHEIKVRLAMCARCRVLNKRGKPE
jgi:hypothetical protein